MENESKERQILRAAEELFTTRRYHEVTLDDVCKAAAVGKGTIYRYFKDKDDLFARVALSGSQELCSMVRGRPLGDGRPFEAHLSELLRDMRTLMGRRREIFRLMHSEEMRQSSVHNILRGKWMERRRDLHAAVSEIIRAGVSAGAIRPDIPAEIIASALLGVFRGYVWHRDGDGDLDGEQMHLQLVDLFLRGATPNSVMKETAS